MLKKIFITLLIAPVLGFAIYGYIHFKRIKSPSVSAIQAIPENALAIIKCNNPKINLAHFSDQNPFWKDLTALPFFESLNSQIEAIKDNVLQSKEALKMIEGQELYVCFYKSSPDKYECLFSLNLPQTVSEKQITNFILSASQKKISNKEKHANKSGIWKIPVNNNTIYYYLKNGVFACAYSEKLINASLLQMESNRSLLNETGFSKLLNTTGKKVEASIFLNYKNISVSFAKAVFKSKFSLQNDLATSAGWSSLDLIFKDNSIVLNGFTCIDASQKSYLKYLQDQVPVEISVWSQIPANAAYVKGICLSSYKTFLINQLGSNKSTKKDTDTSTYFNHYFGNEFYYVITEPSSNNYSDNCFGLLKFNDKNDSSKIVHDLSLFYQDGNYRNDSSQIEYRNFILKKLPQQFVLPSLFKNSLNKIKEPYFTIVEDVMVLANSNDALKKWINSVMSKQTLGYNIDFKEFSSTFSSKATLFEYASFARCEKILRSEFKSDFLNWNDAKKSILQKSHAGFYQVSAGKDFLYTSASFEYKSCYKKPMEGIINTKLDSSIYTKPFVFEDISDKSQKIFLQDASENIYLIASSGEIIWKKKLASKIIGKIHCVKKSRTEESMLTFCTAQELYLINLSGEDENNFPIKLESESSNGVFAFDYGKNADVRLWVAAKNNSISCYTLDGNIARGWENPSTKNSIAADFNQIKIKGERFIVSIDTKGHIKLFDQNGKTKYESANQLKQFNNQYSIILSKTLASSGIAACDSSGEIWQCNFKGEKRKILSNGMSKNLFYNYLPKMDCGIICSNNKLSVTDKNRNKEQVELSGRLLLEPALAYTAENDFIVGITEVGKLLRIYNSKCQVIEAFEDHFTTSPVFCHLFKDANWHIIAGSGDRLIGFVLKSEFNPSMRNKMY